MKNLLLALSAVSAVSLVACDKGAAPKPTQLSADEARVFELLPGDANVVIGGNYMKVQELMTSFSPMFENMGSGMKTWADCFSAMGGMRVGGTGALEGAAIEMRIVFTGLTLDQIEGCAGKAGYAVTKDSDGKYLSVEMTVLGQTMQQGYLATPNGALYTRQQVMIGSPTPMTAARAELEADLASLAGKPKVLENPRFAALAGKVDRKKTVWIAGLGAGTPIADKLDEAYGTIDLVGGVAFDFTIVFTDASLASQIADGAAQAKKQAKGLPAELRPVIEGLVVERSGSRVRIAAKLNEAQIKTLMAMPGMFGR
jgi:hypothetical protein